MDVTLPNGKVITGVPDGTSKEDIKLKAISSGMASESDFPQVNVTQPVSKQVTPKQEPSIGENIIGGIENLASITSGALAEPVAGLKGIYEQVTGGDSTKAITDVRSMFTYKPRTEAGKNQQQELGEFLSPLGETISIAESFLGDEVLDLTGSPVLASIAHTLPSAALELFGVKGARRAAAIKSPSEKAIKRALIDSAPDIKKLKNTSRAIFTELDNSGVSIKQSSLKKLERSLDHIAKKEGIRERVTPEAFGAIQEVKKDISAGNPLSTSQMDELRTIAKNSIVATDPNKARVGSVIVDEIDSFLDNIKPTDIERGAQISATDVGKKYKTARQLWGRAKRSEMIQDAIEMGSSRKAGVEKGIRNELNNLLNRKKSRKFLTGDDVKAIRKVTDGDFKQNFASMVGGMGLKLENSPSIFGGILSGGGVGAVASTIPGLGGSIAPIAVGAITVGTISKEIAKKMTRNRANFLKTMSGAGVNAEKITKAYLQAVPKAKRNIADLSDLLIDPDINLSELQNIANETVKDAVNAAKFKRDLLQAGAVIGAGASLDDNANDNKSSEKGN